MGLREELLASGPAVAQARPAAARPRVQRERTTAQALGIRHATQVAAFGVLEHPDDANVADEDLLADEYYHRAQAGVVRERISDADRTLMDGVPTESLAFDNADAAHRLALAEQGDWRLDKGPQSSDFCWELAWRLEELLA